MFIKYHSDLPILEKLTTQKKRKKGREGTGRMIKRSDGKIYEDMNQLMSENPQANYTAKIYKAMKYKKPVYGYYWEWYKSKVTRHGQMIIDFEKYEND